MLVASIFCSALALFSSAAIAVPLTYDATGKLTQPEVKPYTPAGGIETNATAAAHPYYHPLSDFDYESLSLGLYQEYVELDLFEKGLEMFSHSEFEAAGLNAEDRFLIEFMRDQEVGHARLISNILGASAPKRCTYKYPFTTVEGFINFCQLITRSGESGVYGFLEHLDSRAAANLLLQSISVEARQQQVFREFEGLPSMVTSFIPGITQSMAWTLLAPYITGCPAGQNKLVWQNFPLLNVTNNPSVTGDNWLDPAITHNRTALSYPGKQLHLSWENAGKAVGPNNSYTTNTTATGSPSYAAFISQLNVTYAPLTNISGNTAFAAQPAGLDLAGFNVNNGTIFVLIVDADIAVTPFNVSAINSHVIAGPAFYQSG